MSQSTTEPDEQRFGDLVSAYLAKPDESTLRDLRRAVVASPTFDPDLNLRVTLGPALRDGDHAEVAERLAALMPGAALNPTAHRMLSFALATLGDDAGARREAMMSRLSVSSVLASGDGTEDRPWSVLRVADEYDVLHAQQLTTTGQSASAESGRLVDRHVIDDGRTAWFVIDDPRRAEVAR